MSAPGPGENPFREPPPTPVRSNLSLRLMTAAAGIPLVVGLVVLGGWPFALAAGAIAALAGLEFVHGWLFPRMPFSAIRPVAPMAVLPAVVVAGAHSDERFVWLGIAVGVLFAVAGLAPTRMFGPRKPHRVVGGALLYAGVPFSTMVLLRDGQDGLEWVLFGLIATWTTDTGAYAVGRLLGRHRLAPRISPKKTWEGAAGGFVAGAASVYALNALLDLDVATGTLAPLAVALPVVCQLGDLLESWMKRRMAIKDSSGLLPGHGGFLDRIDSLLVVFPLVYGFVAWRLG